MGFGEVSQTAYLSQIPAFSQSRCSVEFRSVSPLLLTLLPTAERYNIDTITLQEAKESDWVERARQLLQLSQLSVEVIVGVRKGAKILVAPPSGPPYPPPPQLGNQDETMLYDPTGKPLATVARVGDEVFSEPEVWEKIAQEVAPNTYVRPVLEAIYRNGTYIEDAAGNNYRVIRNPVEECLDVMPPGATSGSW